MILEAPPRMRDAFMKKKFFAIFLPIICLVATSLFSLQKFTFSDDKFTQNTLNNATSAVDIPPAYPASSAPKSQKGGAIYLEEGATMHFDGGTIEGSNNVFGGAIFLEKGATLIMTAGTIRKCSASYGGGIYVSQGSTCTITGGTITNCDATYGPAIFVESDANFSCTSTGINESEIFRCEKRLGEIPEQVTVKSAGQVLHSGEVVLVGQFLDVEYAIKDDYYMDMVVKGAEQQPSGEYLVFDNIEIEYTQLPATLDKIKFKGGSFSYEVSGKSDEISGEVVIPNYHEGIKIGSIAIGNPPYTNPFTGQVTGTLTGFYLTDITSVLIPDTVTQIKALAFSGCSRLKSLVIGGSVEEIGDKAFYENTGLNDIKIDPLNQYYTSQNLSGEECGCIIEKASKTILYGSNTAYIPNDESVTAIAEKAFFGLTSLSTVNIPSNVKTVGDRAFSGCKNLISLKIDSGVVSIGSDCFFDCTALKTIDVKVQNIGKGAFLGCKALTDISLNGVNQIADEAFNGCENISSITIPSSVTFIGDNAFYNCTSITELNFEEGIESIGINAFFGLNITSLKIPASLIDIGTDAFYGSTGLNEILVAKNNPVYTSQDKSGNECNMLLIIKKGVIEKELVLGCNNTILPNDGSIKKIEGAAFFGYAELESLTIPDSVEEIEMGCFAMCSGLKSLTVSSGNQVYTSRDMSNTELNCIIEKQTKTLVFGHKLSIIPSDGSVKVIGSLAFYYSCPNYIHITSDMTIQTWAVYGCSNFVGFMVYKTAQNVVLEPDAVVGCDSYKGLLYEGDAF